MISKISQFCVATKQTTCDMKVEFQIMHVQNDKWEKSDTLKTMHATEFKLNHANYKNLTRRKIITCSFDLNQKCCRHHHVNQRTVCNYVCVPLHLWKCIRAFAAVCISECDIILGFKLSSVMLSGKKGHVWFRYDWWLWPTYQFTDFHIDKQRSEQLLIMLRNETLSQTGFQSSFRPFLQKSNGKQKKACKQSLTVKLCK